MNHQDAASPIRLQVALLQKDDGSLSLVPRFVQPPTEPVALPVEMVTALAAEQEVDATLLMLERGGWAFVGFVAGLVVMYGLGSWLGWQ